MRIVCNLLFIIFISCSSVSNLDANKIEGKYVLDKDFYGVGAELNLNKDGFFEYKWQTGLIGGITKGKYEVLIGEILLNSEYQPEDKVFQNKYKIFKSELKNSDSIKVKIVDKNNTSFRGVDCFIKKEDSIIYETISNKFGFAKLPKIKGDSLCFHLLGFDYVSIPIKYLEGDSFVLELNEKNPDLEYYHFFSNEKLKHKKNKLKSISDKYLKVE